MSKRPVNLCSGQFGDLSLEELCRVMKEIGYDGFELASQSHIDVNRIVNDKAYRDSFQNILTKYSMGIGAISCHLMGQCVGDNWDSRLDNFAPARVKGKPEEIRAWAIEGMKTAAKAADFARIRELWTPIFDVYDECGVRLALEVHPTEIAFDYWSTKRLLEELDFRPTLGLNFDPSHLLWQGVDPQIFLHDFAKQIYHVHMKDVKLSRDGRSGILGSHIEFGDTRRGWNFVSLGHGDVDFDGIIRELNQMGYHGPLCVEWEDSGMERLFGAREALEFTRRINFEPSLVSFDAALKAD